MFNAFIQDIKVNDWVYRGARQRNSSEFKIGIVTSLNKDKGTARVNWHYQQGYLFVDSPDKRITHRLYVPRRIVHDSYGFPGIETLVFFSKEDVAFVQDIVLLLDSLKWRESFDEVNGVMGTLSSSRARAWWQEKLTELPWV